MPVIGKALKNRRRLNFRVQGSGPPLILLHGLAGSFDWWNRNTDLLSQRYQTYCIDLAGFGGSRRLHSAHIEQIAPSVTAWMEELGIQRASLVGHSMGGLIASRIAVESPDRVNKLILVDAAFLSFNAGTAKRSVGLMRALRSIPRDFFPVFARDALRAHPVSMISATYELLKRDWSAHLGAIDVPTLIIWGENDTITPLKIGEAINGIIPGSKLVVIEDAGHNPMWDQPESFNAEVVKFLD
jgi:pimeloyl-ACP methyl ester carboxylesterase